MSLRGTFDLENHIPKTFALQFRHYLRRIRQRVTRSGLVLLYHRVADSSADPQLLCVSRKNFSEQMDILRHFAEPQPLCRLTRGLRDRRLPRRSIVVTFDDGYADNLHNAKPILERAEVPATVYVTSGYVGKMREYWWDELQRLLLCPGRLPDAVDLRVPGLTLEWRLGDSANYTEQDYRRDEQWNVTHGQPPTERHALYLALHRMIRPLPDDGRRAVFEAIHAWAGCGPHGRETHLSMTASEVQQLAAGGLIEVGAHNVTHPVLSELSADAQRKEIAESKRSLEEILNRPVRSFAYPFGGKRDYTAASVSAVRDAGFDSACSNYPGLVRKGTDCFELPRILVRNWNGDEFSRLMRDWLHAG